MKSLSPLFVFLTLYLGLSVATGDFYCVPVTVAFLAASVWAVATTRSIPLTAAIDVYSRGAANGGMMTMVWIFVLAGAFAECAKAMGAVDATVAATMSLLPPQMLLAGLFVAACFVSLSVGTSVGTIVALAPIAAGIADRTGASLPMVVATVVGGAFFGDNLSFISDTTIVATRTQGCRLSDKFRANVALVTPAAVLCLLVYLYIGFFHLSAPSDASVLAPESALGIDWLRITPYIIVLGAAIAGADVMLVLVAGIVLTGVIGVTAGAYDLTGWMQAMGRGIESMGELIIVTMMAAGVVEIIRHNGGMEWMMNRLTRHVRTRRGAEMSIAAMVVAADVCTANNTVAIITVGPIARDIARRFGIDPRRAASLLDTFSCMTQGLIPYGAQLLMAASLALISPIEIIQWLFYPLTLGLYALISIVLQRQKR